MSIILRNISKCIRTTVREPIQIRSLARKAKACSDGNDTSLAKLKKNQELFQKDNGVPVFLKRGTSDKIWFQAVLVLIGIASVIETKMLVELATK